MNKSVLKGLLVAAFLLVGYFSQAQNTDELLEKANKQYNLYAYNLAVRSYRTVLEQEPGNVEAISRLADCYRQLNQPDESVKWYERASKIAASNPAVFYNFGKTLASLGRYDEAQRQFLQYAATNATVGNHFASGCDFAKAHGDDAALFSAKNEPVNTSASDFGATFYGNNVVFSSARSDIARKIDKKEASDWTGDAYNQLFVSNTDKKGFLGKPSFLKSDLENNFNEGPVSFVGEKLVYARNNFVDGSRQVGATGVRMSLYLGELIDGKWANVKPFAWNGDFSNGYATFSPDGKTMFFASDREGGFGGWDLYSSTFNGKSWNAPENLGENVNAPGDEITPFFDGKTLFFASDWHDGFGGMDVFKTDLDGGDFRKITHLGPGVNSSRDDYGFVFNEKMNLGYLTSNRKGGKGNEDIWQISRAVELYTIAVIGENKPIGGAEIDFSACGGKKVVADKNGKLEFSLLDGTPNCTAVVRKPGFEALAVEIYSGMKSKNLLATMKRVSEGSDASVELTPTTYATPSAPTAKPAKGSSKNFDGQYVGRVANADTRGFLDNVFVKAVAQPSGKSSEIFTDADGRFGFDLEPGTTYKITASRAGFAEESINFKADAKQKDLGAIALRDAYSAIGSPVKQAETPVAVVKKDEPKTAEPAPEKAKPAVITAAEPDKIIPKIEDVKKAEIQPEAPKPVVYQAEKPSEIAPKTTVFTEEKAEKPAGYSVQVASIDGLVDNAFLKKYANLATLGNVFAMPQGKMSKIRVGVFLEKSTADAAQNEAKKLGYKGAFVVSEKTAETALFYPKNNPADPIISEKPTEKLVVKAAEKPAEPAKKIEPPVAKTPEKESESAILVIANKKEEAAIIEKTPEPDNRPKRWCVQVAFLTNSGEAVDMSAYATLFETGNVYTIPEKENTKVRVGVWDNKEDAEKGVEMIHKKGFKDALVLEEKAVYRTERLLIKNKILNAETPKQASKTSKNIEKAPEKLNANSPYSVRVASYKDVDNFSEESFSTFGGRIQQKKEGKTTVIYLTEFADLEAAISTKNKAVLGGFTDAYIVKLENGKMIKLKL